MSKKHLLGLAVAAALAACPSLARAQDDAAPDYNTGALTLSGGVDYTTAYFFRGYNQEDTGIILQPWATITTTVVERDNYTLNAYVGMWNSFHEKKTFADATGPSTWYESDFYGGFDVICNNFTFGAVYTFYTYPNGAFDTIQELGLKVAYDDTEFTEGKIGFALKPYAGVYFETADGNGSEDVYGEIGVAPSFTLGNSGVTLAVPVAIGLSLDDYYLDDDGDNELLGYASIGAFASMPLGDPTRFGTWTLTGGIQYIQLFADSAEAVNDGGEEYELLGKVGVSFVY